ncbi:MAG TPA: hypothetical protein VJ751_07005 [Pyrinomonadaceae bacterium]|nr:hypothetical protein [Pyrinomonadaceae bacterium]
MSPPPLSAGIVKISPLASTTTRLPVGDSRMLVRRFETSSQFVLYDVLDRILDSL